jgi:hypothetical protein
VEASEYLWPKKGKGKRSLMGFAELTFGAADPKTRVIRDFSPVVERVVAYRNPVEHEGG